MFGGFGPYSQDILAGGSGVDTFILAATNFSIEKSKCDVISDFDTSNDKIGLELGLHNKSYFGTIGSDCYGDGNRDYCPSSEYFKRRHNIFTFHHNDLSR